jgi:biopolymer transport protein ExbD
VIRRAMLANADDPGRSISSVLIPMADVVFLLIVFLLLGQSRLYEAQVSVSAGRAGPATGEPPPTVFVSIIAAPEGPQYRVNGGPWGGREDMRRSLGLAAAARASRVVVDPGPGVSFAEAMDVLDQAGELGIAQLSMMARDEPNQ